MKLEVRDTEPNTSVDQKKKVFLKTQRTVSHKLFKSSDVGISGLNDISSRSIPGLNAIPLPPLSSLAIAVVSFMQVYNKSLCQTREVLVDIYQEYPDRIEHTYIPACVILKRCSGYCSDEAMECVPTRTRNVTMEVSTCCPRPLPTFPPSFPVLPSFSRPFLRLFFLSLLCLFFRSLNPSFSCEGRDCHCL